MEMEDFDDEIINHLCMYMRMVELFNACNEEVESNPELKDAVSELNEKVNSMMDLLTEDQKNRVLEAYEKQNQKMNKQNK